MITIYSLLAPFFIECMTSPRPLQLPQLPASLIMALQYTKYASLLAAPIRAPQKIKGVDRNIITNTHGIAMHFPDADIDPLCPVMRPGWRTVF